MTNWTELKRLAEEATIARPGSWYTQDDCCWWTGNADEGDFISAANPKTILALIAENERLLKERDEADRRAGAAERMHANGEDSRVAADRWKTNAKREAGYDIRKSFDIVWRETLDKARKYDDLVSRK